ncbi:MAG: single-stranded DNA-binding protein [Alphaproteobacteria bacterium GM7ARS4]|nr:single-stranded DNA-binding protein [Alphaproteobacteria bacterium GM7ARS4]
MAGSLNKVMLIGRLGGDPDIRSTQAGSEVATFSVATSDVWKDKQSGERQERVHWHRVVIFDENLASVAKRFLRKGALVYLEGQLQTRKWTDQSGAERYTTEVVLSRYRSTLTMLGGRGDGGGGDSGAYGRESYGGKDGGIRKGASSSGGERSGGGSFEDDDIPF